MSIYKNALLEFDHIFNNKSCRHSVNNDIYVLHCHHYTSLFTQLAIDSNEMFGGIKVLTESAEDSFNQFFNKYFIERPNLTLIEKISVAEQYYSFAGLGKMIIKSLGENSGEIVLESSHVDEGWIKKWGQYDKPINFITCGFISALFSSVFNKKTRTY